MIFGPSLHRQGPGTQRHGLTVQSHRRGRALSSAEAFDGTSELRASPTHRRDAALICITSQHYNLRRKRVPAQPAADAATPTCDAPTLGPAYARGPACTSMHCEAHPRCTAAVHHCTAPRQQFPKQFPAMHLLLVRPTRGPAL